MKGINSYIKPIGSSIKASGGMFDGFTWASLSIASTETLSQGGNRLFITGSSAELKLLLEISQIIPNGVYISAVFTDNTKNIATRITAIYRKSDADISQGVYMHVNEYETSVVSSTVITGEALNDTFTVINETTGDMYVNREVIKTGTNIIFKGDYSKTPALTVGGTGSLTFKYGEIASGGGSGTGGGGGTSAPYIGDVVGNGSVDIYNSNPANVALTKHKLTSIVEPLDYTFFNVEFEMGTFSGTPMNDIIGYLDLTGGVTTATDTPIYDRKLINANKNDFSSFYAYNTSTSDLEYIRAVVTFYK